MHRALHWGQHQMCRQPAISEYNHHNQHNCLQLHDICSELHEPSIMVLGDLNLDLFVNLIVLGDQLDDHL